MAWDFPASPTVGQEYVPVAGLLFKWNGYAWDRLGGGAAIEVSDTPPASPVDRALWFESDAGILWLRYNDGSSAQWLDMTGNAQVGLDEPPVGGGEYVRINGAWRLKEQYFDMGGFATQDVTVPVGARACQIEGYVVPVPTASMMIMRYSLDGTAFLNGATDYAYFGYTLNTGSGGVANAGWPNAAFIYLTFQGDAGQHPHHFVSNITLTRPDVTRSIGMMFSHSTVIDSNAANTARTSFFSGYMSYVTAGSVLGIKAIRILQMSGAALPAGSWLNVKWSY